MRNSTVQQAFAGLGLCLVTAAFGAFALASSTVLAEGTAYLAALVLMGLACWCWAMVALVP